ncbi:MAG: hypothetical protein K0S80_5163 [Neobacillus sp.]|nr:hypothetical protein [Neobacillus sp.]
MTKQIISWIDANGVEHLLSDSANFQVLLGSKGFYMPPFSFAEEEVPFQPGSRLRNVKVKARDVDLPLRIIGINEIDLENNLRNITRIFNPLKADGKIKVTGYDGSQRELFCRYTGGFEMEESSSTRRRTWQKAVGVFRAFDPFWYDSSTKVQTFKINESPGLFFPILPLRLASSTVFADISIDNTGDVETWPEWIITGPCDSVTLTNLTTGETTNLEVTLEVGETITIDTRPFQKTITKSDGTNLFYTMTDDSSLWSIQDGNNAIQIQMANATADSSVQLTYRNRYWGP